MIELIDSTKLTDAIRTIAAECLLAGPRGIDLAIDIIRRLGATDPTDKNDILSLHKKTQNLLQSIYLEIIAANRLAVFYKDPKTEMGQTVDTSGVATIPISNETGVGTAWMERASLTTAIQSLTDAEGKIPVTWEVQKKIEAVIDAARVYIDVIHSMEIKVKVGEDSINYLCDDFISGMVFENTSKVQPLIHVAIARMYQAAIRKRFPAAPTQVLLGEMIHDIMSAYQLTQDEVITYALLKYQA